MFIFVLEALTPLVSVVSHSFRNWKDRQLVWVCIICLWSGFPSMYLGGFESEGKKI